MPRTSANHAEHRDCAALTEAAHAEVLSALHAIGNPQRGEAIRIDRGSALQHLGIGFPALRQRVLRPGFSFSRAPLEEQLRIWNLLWRHSPVADVLFAAIEHFAPLARHRSGPPLALWQTVQHWPARVDNWCHSDALSGLVSRCLQWHTAQVLPTLQAWGTEPGLWYRRLSLTALVHYSGKNAVFLPSEVMRPLLAAQVADHREPVALALGWVLRELGRADPPARQAFLAEHAPQMAAAARRRALA
jgi:3-methyladenine DNA glycosylase AlkD